jgi:hypothetical protein
MSDIDNDDKFGEEETKERMEKGLRRALSTPHKPNSKFVGKSVKADSAESKKPSRRRTKPKSA